MNNNHEEHELKELLKKVKARKPSQSVLNNFEKEVLQKIHRPGFPRGITFSFAAALIVAGAALYILLPPQPSQTLPAPETIAAQIGAPVFQEKPATDSKAEETLTTEEETEIMDELSQDLFILEMLGEDEGLIDGFERMSVETAFMTQHIAGGQALTVAG